jgi:hypothetical protein
MHKSLPNRILNQLGRGFHPERLHDFVFVGFSRPAEDVPHVSQFFHGAAFGN